MRTKLLNNLIWAGKNWFASPSDKTDDGDVGDQRRVRVSHYDDEVEDDGKDGSSGRSSTTCSVGSSEPSEDEEVDNARQDDGGPSRISGGDQETARHSMLATATSSTYEKLYEKVPGTLFQIPARDLSTAAGSPCMADSPSRMPAEATRTESIENSDPIEFERYADRIREVRKTEYPALRGEYYRLPQFLQLYRQ
jgi:hypothetical protein